MRKKSTWMSPKHKTRVYVGTYRYAYGEREFVLKSIIKGQQHNVTFESHEAAVKLGWKKVA